MDRPELAKDLAVVDGGNRPVGIEPDQLAYIEEAARANGLDLSDYLRSAGMEVARNILGVTFDKWLADNLRR